MQNGANATKAVLAESRDVFMAIIAKFLVAAARHHAL
jgi:hypothetical protein